MEFNIERILKLIRKNFLLLIAGALLASGAAYVYTKNSATPIYYSYAEIYIHSKSDENLIDGFRYETSLLPTYIEMLKTYSFAEEVHSALPEEYKPLITRSGIKSAVGYASKNSTQILRVSVRSPNRDLAYEITKAVTKRVDTYLFDWFGIYSVDIVEEARNGGVSTVSTKRNTIIGAVFGIIIVFGFLFIKDMYDFRVRSVDEVTGRYSIPVLGVVPVFDSKGGKEHKKYGYRYRR